MRGRPTICGPGGTIPAVVVLFTRDRGHNTRAPAVEGRPTFYQHISVLYFSVTFNPHINPNINTRAAL